MTAAVRRARRDAKLEARALGRAFGTVEWIDDDGGASVRTPGAASQRYRVLPVEAAPLALQTGEPVTFAVAVVRAVRVRRIRVAATVELAHRAAWTAAHEGRS